MTTPADNHDQITILRRAFLEIKQLQGELETMERSRSEPIAIIGMGCRFPGANSPDEFWALLRDRVDAVTDVPESRWDLDAYYDPDPDAPGKVYTRRGGFIHDVDKFDPGFFNISPREALSMDPQQRLLLEVAWEAIESAGQSVEKLAGSQTGVFVGISTSDYVQRFGDPSSIDAYMTTGNSFSVAAGRLSYVLGLQGPSMAIDTACSSSLVAAHLACQSLRSGESRLALAGGVNLLLAPLTTVALCRLHMMAPDGRCKTFDAKADGFVRAEGCGLVVLKCLSDAVADRDHIVAVIRGSAVNQDGRSGGLTAPNGLAQEAVIRQALARARVAPLDVSYVEAHGTGTILGDPVEVQALASVLAKGRSRDRSLAIGSVKTNIGHAEAAAGAAGLIKVALALQAREIPAHLHLEHLSPHIPLDQIPIVIPTERTAWASDIGPRRAGVSSFGFSGTNAHFVLEEAPTPAAAAAGPERPEHVLCLSAKSEPALRALAARVEARLAASAPPEFPDVCFTANSGRSHFAHRLALRAPTADAARDQLRAFGDQQPAPGLQQGHVEPGTAPKVAFLFTGQGAQYRGMGRQLFETQPQFRATLERCDAILRPHLAHPLLDVLYGPDPATASLLDQTAYTQPALFALEYALADVWRGWGIVPGAVLGHSLGEFVAACVAGVYSLEEALPLVAARAQLMQALPADGAMAAVFANPAHVAAALRPAGGRLAIAAINGPALVVVSGERTALEPLLAQWRADGVRAERLTVSHAFHSPLMEPMLAALEQRAATVPAAPPRLLLVSNLTGQPLTAAPAALPAYWRRQAREPVQFARGIETLVAQGTTVFVEIGPTPTLLGLARTVVADPARLQWLPSLRRGQADWAQLLDSLAALYVAGAPVHWPGVDRDYPRRKVALPTYPFQRQRYWIEPPAARAEGTARTLAPDANEDHWLDWLYEIDWRPSISKPSIHAAKPTDDSRWLILADRTGLGLRLAEVLKSEGEHAVLVHQGELASAFSDERYRGIIDLWSLDDREEDCAPGNPSHCGHVLDLIRASARSEGSDSARLWLVTRGVHAVASEAVRVDLAHSPIWGLGRVIAYEHPGLWGGLIDLDPGAPTDEASLLAREILRPDGEDQIAFRGADRLVARLTPARSLASSARRVPLRGDSTYLITGGLGDLGLGVARWMAANGAKHLVLVGRRGPGDADQLLAEFAAMGINLHVLRCDVSQQPEVASLLETVRTTMPALRGVVHAAGVVDDGPLAGQNVERFAKVMAPKVAGAWNLHSLTDSLPLDFFVCFSSAASLLGSPGQGNYAAANAFLDALSHYRRALGLPAVSINWGPWAEHGMAARAESKGARRWAEFGMGSIEPARGLRILELALGWEKAQLAVLPVDWAKLGARFDHDAGPRLLSEVVSNARTRDHGVPTAPDRTPLEEVFRLSPPERTDFVRAYLRRRVAGILHMEPADLPGHRSIFESGADSLMLIELINGLKYDFRIMLYPREVYERPSIDALASYIAGELDRTHGGGTVRRASPSRDVAPKSGPLATRARRTPTPEVKLPGAVFLLSSPRSGSTLLRVMLAGHPSLFCPPELHLLPFGTMNERRQRLRGTYLGEGLQRAFMELQGMDASGSQALLESLADNDTPVHAVYGMLQDAAGARLLVDKSPTYAGDVATLKRAEELFEGAKYIHLVRHPYAVIESFVRNRMDKLVDAPGADPYELGAHVWSSTNRNTLSFLREVDPPRWQQLRYEDLVREPARVMSDLCEFLGVPFDEAVLTPYEGNRMTDGVHARSLAIGDPNFLDHASVESDLGDTWKTIRLPQALDSVSRGVAKDLGYELPTEIDAAVPSLEASDKSSAPAGHERFVTVRDLPMCLNSWGPEDGPLLVCLHGILDHGASWEDVAVALAARGLHVVAPDQRGHGLSGHVGPGGSYHLMDFVADLDAVTAELSGGPFILAGHSMGAAVAATFAALRPKRVKALVLVECPLPPERSGPEDIGRLATHLDYMVSSDRHPIFADVESAAARLQQVNPAISRDLALRSARRTTVPCEGGVRWRWDPRLRTRAGIVFPGLDTLDRAGYLESLARIEAPITLVYGERSLNDDHAMRAVCQAADRVAVLPGGHDLHLESAGPLAEIIADVASASPLVHLQVVQR